MKDKDVVKALAAKHFNQHFAPSDCDVHYLLLKSNSEVPALLSIKNVRALLTEYGTVSEKYLDEWRNKAIMLTLGSAISKKPLTISDVTAQIKLIQV